MSTSIARSADRARAENRSATCARSSREETGSRRTESRPWSARARTSRSSARRARRSASAAAERTVRSSSACERGRRRASSSSALRIASGVRSSWPGVGDEGALPLERRLEPVEHGVQRLAQAVDLVVRAGQGQAPARLGGRDRGGLRAHRLHGAKGRRGEPVPEERGEDERGRPDDEELGEEPPDGLVAVVERRAEHEDARAARRPHRDGEEPGTARDARRPVDLRRDRAAHRAGELVLVEQRLRPQGGRLLDDPAVRSEQLGEALVRVGARACEGRLGISGPHGRDDVGGTRREALVDGLIERVGEPDVEEHAGRDEDDRHGEREGEGEAKADRKPAHRHSRRSRYPAPRTVSIELRPKGRSTFSRR